MECKDNNDMETFQDIVPTDTVLEDNISQCSQYLHWLLTSTEEDYLDNFFPLTRLIPSPFYHECLKIAAYPHAVYSTFGNQRLWELFETEVQKTLALLKDCYYLLSSLTNFRISIENASLNQKKRKSNGVQLVDYYYGYMKNTENFQNVTQILQHLIELTKAESMQSSRLIQQLETYCYEHKILLQPEITECDAVSVLLMALDKLYVTAFRKKDVIEAKDQTIHVQNAILNLSDNIKTFTLYIRTLYLTIKTWLNSLNYQGISN